MTGWEEGSTDPILSSKLLGRFSMFNRCLVALTNLTNNLFFYLEVTDDITGTVKPEVGNLIFSFELGIGVKKKSSGAVHCPLRCYKNQQCDMLLSQQRLHTGAG